MAEAYRCDCCGKLFAERPRVDQDVTKIIAIYTDRGYLHPLDMCKECVNDLQKWVKSRKLKE